MAASDEAMYITPTSETIEHLDVLRKDGESFSDIVARLAADQIKERIVHGDAMFLKLTPDLREAVDKVRHDGELYSSAMIRIVRAFQNMEDVRFGKIAPDLWQSLDKFRGEDESYVEVINRLIVAYDRAGDSPMSRIALPEALWQKLDSVRKSPETYPEEIDRMLEEHLETKNVGMSHVVLNAALWQKLDSVRGDGETYDEELNRLLDEHALVSRHNVVYLTKTLEDDLIAARTDGETKLSTIERMVRAYKAYNDERVGKFTLKMWQELDDVRDESETYVGVIHRLIDEHNTHRDSYTVYITKSMQDDLNTIRENDETYVGTIHRLIQEDLAQYGSYVIHLAKSMQDNLNIIRKSLRDDPGVLTDADETYVGLVCRLIKEKLAAKNASVDEFPLPIRMKLDAFRSNGESYTSVIDHLIQSRNAVAASQETRQLVHLTKSMRNDLDVINNNETQIGVIARLIKEHLTIKQQEAMTPLGSTKVMRVKPETCYRVESMARVGEDYNAIITRLIDERYLCRKIANGMAEEGQRLLHNQSAIINNFKLVIKELVEMDAVNVRDKDNIVQRDVDELLAEMFAALSDEEGDST